MLDAVLADGGRSGVSALARATGVPVATAHRHVASLADEGFLTPLGAGRHVAGPRLLAIHAGIDVRAVLADVSRPFLADAARQLGCVVQLGTLDGDMVTYRVKEGRAAGALFTRVGLQLEAYCSAIGKVLLAHLSDAERARYLDGGPFVALTANTIIYPDALARELDRVRREGRAFDREEIAERLACIALPLRDSRGVAVAAISASLAVVPGELDELERALPVLSAVREKIETTVFGARHPARA